MGKKNRMHLAFVLIIILLGLFVYAVPQIPTGYDGDVLVDGTIPPIGTAVYVKDVYSMTVGNDSDGTDASGGYSLNVGRESSDNSSDAYVIDGETITFYVAGIQSNSTVVGAKGAAIHNFDLSVSDSTSPSAPVGVSAIESNVSNQSIVNISWTGTTDNIWTNLSYLIFRSTSSGVSSSDTYIETIYFNGTGTTSITDIVASDGSTYYYTVYANDTSGNLGSSATEDSVKVSNLVPAQVTGLSATSLNETINLTWTAVTTHNNSAPIGSDLAGYKVFSNYSGTWILVATTTESSYQNNTLTNGESYCYQIAAYDQDSNEGENSSEVCVSPSERPTISITPASNSEIKSTDAIYISITSGQNLDEVSYFVYNVSGAHVINETNTSVSTTSWAYNITAATWQENIAHTLNVTANDTNGQVNSIVYNYVVDDTNPIVHTSDSNDSDNKIKSTDSITLSVNATDANTVSSVLVNGSSMSQSGDIWSLSTTAASFGCTGDRTCILTFVATDSAGNINNTETLTLTIDDLAPSVFDSNTNDSDNLVKSTDSLNITVNVTDTNTVSTVSVNGTSMVEGASGVWSTVNSTANFGCTGDRACILTFIATDELGNINNSYTLTITVDDLAPSVFDSNTNDSDNIVKSTDSLNITVNVTDTNTVSTVSVNGTSMVEGANGVWSTVNKTSDFGCTGDRACILTFIATDELGNINNSYTLTITVDDVNPVVLGSNTDDSDNYVKSTDSLNITVNVTDTNTVSTVSVNGTTMVEGANGVWSTVNSTANFGCTGDRACILTFIATDIAGNINNSHTLTISVDDVNPSINSVSLADDYVMPSQIVEVTVNVTDSYTTAVTVNGNSLSNLTTANDLWAANITMPSTTGYLTVVATDNAGNTNTTNNTGFIVDSDVPVFTFSTPISGGTYSATDGNITFNFSVSDQNLTMVNVSIDSGLYRNGSTNNGTNIWKFSGLEAGIHNVLFSATDEPGWNTSQSFNFTIYRPLNMTEFRGDLETEMGDVVTRINITANETDLNNNDTAEVNQTITIEIGLNASGINATAVIPGFQGLRARWEHTFGLETNTSSSKGNRAALKSGESIQRLVLFENTTRFLDKTYFGMATITFDVPLGNQDVFFIEDDEGHIIYKLSECSSVPSSVANAAAACYMNTSINVTLYLPHFSGGALGNDSSAPTINITYPSNDTLITDSLFDLNLTINEANPRLTNFCNYTLYNGSTLEKQDTAIAVSEMSNDGSTEYTYSVKLQNISDGDYNLTVNCVDLKNQSSSVIYNLSVADTTNPIISSYTPSADVTSSSTSVTVTLSATTSEYAICKFGTTNGTYTSLSSYLGSNSVYGLTHSTETTYTSDDASEVYYVVCQDQAGRNSTVQQISYSVDVTAEDSGSSGSTSTSTRTSDDTSIDSTKTTLTMSFGNLLPGDLVNWEPSSVNIPVKGLKFTASEELNFITMKVSAFNSKPESVEELSNIFKYLEISGIGFNAAHVKSGFIEISFAVSSSWVDENSNKNTVYLYRYNNGWEQLQTEFVKESDGMYYYKAYTPGFSFFGIAGDAKILEKVVEEETEPEVVEVVEEKVLEGTEEETNNNNIILAIIAVIAFLVAIALFVIRLRKKKTKSLDALYDKIDELEKGKKTEEKVILPQPKKTQPLKKPKKLKKK